MEKIKKYFTAHQRELVLAAVLLFTSTISFATGYMANREFNHTPIIIEKCSDATAH